MAGPCKLACEPGCHTTCLHCSARAACCLGVDGLPPALQALQSHVTAPAGNTVSEHACVALQSATGANLQVLKVMRGEHLPIPDHFSSGLRDMAKQLLSKAPKSRPSTEQCLKAPLLKVGGHRELLRGGRGVGAERLSLEVLGLCSYLYANGHAKVCMQTLSVGNAHLLGLP